MMKRSVYSLIILTALGLAFSAIAVAYVLGVRLKSVGIREAARHYHRAVGNPLQMRSAGTSGAYASVIGHRGRTTGRTYENPVWAMPTEDGFVIAIVYGTRTDWLKNVLAAGTATIVRGGDTYEVGRPEIVPMESARAYFPAALKTIHRGMGVDQCLRVRRIDVAAASAA
jgi:deazaflavin-dependent oxidoreductase (nitroreductase family)